MSFLPRFPFSFLETLFRINKSHKYKECNANESSRITLVDQFSSITFLFSPQVFASCSLLEETTNVSFHHTVKVVVEYHYWLSTGIYLLASASLGFVRSSIVKYRVRHHHPLDEGALEFATRGLYGSQLDWKDSVKLKNLWRRENVAIDKNIKMAGMLENVTLPMVVFPLSLVAATIATFVGHKRLFSTLVVGSVLAGLFLTFFLLEILFFILTPYRLLFGKNERTIPANEASAVASGKRDISNRKIVVFDGVCVLCNRAGQFVVAHLPDPNLVSFVPFQDALANPHVSLAKIKADFPDFREEMLEEKICVISGEKMLWGADAVMEICSWMHAPFPLVKYGWIIPRPIRDLFYIIVSKNRYDWFGTQPLDKNFSKSLCPYLQVRKYLEVQ